MLFNLYISLSHILRSSLSGSRRLFRRPLSRKLICFALMFSLLALPSNLAFQQLPVFASTTVRMTVESVGILSTTFKWLFPSSSAQRQDSLADRLSRVSRITITPLKLVGYQQQVVTFSAMATDAYGEVVQGVRFQWESSHTDKLQIDDAGRATLIQPGLVSITCQAGSASASAPALIRPGRRPVQTDAQWRLDQSALSVVGTSTTGMGGAGAASLLPSLLDKLMPTAHAQTSGYSGTDFPYDELHSEPRNLVGSPRNRIIEPTRACSVLPESSNFQMAIPILSLGGRGVGANLTLFLNSKLWSRHGSAVTFDAISSWPGPGFSLGFGRIIAYGPTNATKYMLVDPDGTRRYLGEGGTRTQNVTLKTQDGTHITYVGNASTGGTLYYPGGTRATISLANNRLVTTQITDTNGNYITISHMDVTCEPDCIENCVCPIYWPPLSINRVTDTLGRIIQFNYDANQNLTSITQPGLGGTALNPITRTVAQFDHESRTVSGNFSGLTVENRPTSSVNFLKHVYFPATQTGCMFSYSDFGMAHTVSLRRQMTISGSVISDGVESANVSFNYPQLGTLTDAPAFTQRTETPGGTFTYSSSDDALAQTKTMTVTLPDTTTQQPVASQLQLTRSTNSSSVASGLMTKSEVKRSATTYAKTEYSYGNDPAGYPQVQSVIGYNDAGVGAKVSFDYDQYGNVTNKREYGFQESGAWQVRRRTRITYKTDTAYINDYIRSLVTQVELLDGLENSNEADDVVVAKSTATYDDYAAMGGMENYSGGAAPPGHLTSYDTTKTVRGNVTGVTEWSDIAGNVSTTRLSKYDVFGNVVKAQASCCNEKSYTYTEATYWSMATEVTSGSLSGVHLTSSATYDFNTGVTNTQTDPNGQTATYSYDSALRNTAVSIPTTAESGVEYFDSTLSSSQYMEYDDENYGSGSVTKTVTSSSKRDGWGQTIEQVNLHGGQVNTIYDAMGRVQSVTNPFQPGQQPDPATTYQYDSLGRVTLVTLPDGNTVQNTYSGNSLTVTDQVNRKIKREADGLGRLVKVTEQDATGALAQETTYSYNALDKLTQVNQGGQTRSYKYDALGRLIYEKIPEQTATINDGMGTFWTTKYTYNDFDEVATRTDARGVVTTYSYDNLHRLTQISYNTANAMGVATTPTVTYNYDTSSSSTTRGLLLSIGVGSNYSESYSYDTYNRVSSVTKTIDSRSYTTSYQYNEIGQAKQVGHMYPYYDSKGRLQEIRNSGGTLHAGNISYNIAGQVTGDKLNGTLIEETFGYDANRMQMTSQTAAKGATTLMSLTYSYQAQAGQNGASTTAGNSDQLMSISGTINATTESAGYTYDLQGRLVTSNQTTNSVSAQRRFAYDPWGNRTGVWDAVSGGAQIQSVSLQQSGGAPTNRLTSVTQGAVVSTYSYDAAGNVTGDGAHSYVYDAENRVVSADTGAHQYGYDHENRRVKKVTGGATRHYVWEGAKVLGEYNGSTGAVLVQYIYLGSRMVGKLEGGTTRYLLSDRLSARVVLDTSGDVVGRQAHLAFGEEIATSGEQEKHRFTNYERNVETSTDYGINRQYSYSLGRFNRPDPYGGSYKVSNPQSLNRYSYVENNPINAIDPLGLLSYRICVSMRFEGGGWTTECRDITDPGAPRTPTELDEDTKKCKKLLSDLERQNERVNDTVKDLFKDARKINKVRADTIRRIYDNARSDVRQAIRIIILTGGQGLEEAVSQFRDTFIRAGQGLLSMFPEARRQAIKDIAAVGLIQANKAKDMALEAAQKCEGVLSGKDQERLDKAMLEATTNYYSAGIFFGGISPSGPPT